MTNPIEYADDPSTFCSTTIADVVAALRKISDIVNVKFHPTDPSVELVIREMSTFYVLVCIDPVTGSIFDESDVCDFDDADRDAPPTYYNDLADMIKTLQEG